MILIARDDGYELQLWGRGKYSAILAPWGLTENFVNSPDKASWDVVTQGYVHYYCDWFGGCEIVYEDQHAETFWQA